MVSEEELANMSPEEIAQLQKQNCIFCKLATGQMPTNKLYEDSEMIAFLDINPTHPGHTLIVPKEHYQVMPQVPSDVLGRMFVVAKQLSDSMLKGMKVKGTTVFVANGQEAGQKAPHFMIHVVPRKSGDGFFEIPKNQAQADDLDKIHAVLAQRLGGPKREEPKPTAPKTIKKPVEDKEETQKTATIEAQEPETEQKPKIKPQNEEPKKSEDKLSLDQIKKFFEKK